MLNWRDVTAPDIDEMNDEQTEYVGKLVELINDQGMPLLVRHFFPCLTSIANEFSRLKESKVYEEDLYFGSQLFERNWHPSHTF